MAGAAQAEVIRARGRRAATRSWWADGLEAAVWFAAATGIALMFNARGVLEGPALNYVYTLGRGLGIVAAVLMMTQVLLASRAPWVERALGHDRAMAKHTRLGKWAISLMLAHWAIITAMTAYYDGKSLLQTTLDWPKLGWFMLLVQLAIVLFAIVLATSIVAVRKRWKYEAWHSVHLLVYVAVAFAVPHQFLHGTTFVGGGAAWWFWATLYTVSFGSFILFRIARPLWIASRFRPVVESVTPLADGSTSIVVSGRDLAKLGAKPGQFFLWRFLQKGHRLQAHPYSLSSAPAGTLRLTVKPSGDGSTALRDIRPGTRVMLEGPLGVFTHDARVGHEVLMVAAGIGVTPVRSMLEAAEPGDAITVVIRARSQAEAPLLDEVTALAREKGATLKVLIGSRGDTWGTVAEPASVAALLASPATADVYVCGPVPWARGVESDALAAGVPAHAIHREEFAW